MDKRDVALQLSCPLAGVPLFSQFVSIPDPGDRVLVAKNGTFLEVRRAWGYFVEKIGDIGVVLPFGELKPMTILHIEKLPMELLDQFSEIARQHADVEIGANVVWKQSTNSFRLVVSISRFATDEKLEYEIPPLEPDEHIVIDCHSHSRGPAFFSPKDNADDADAVKFSFVVGNCDQEIQSKCMRLCVRGVFREYGL